MTDTPTDSAPTLRRLRLAEAGAFEGLGQERREALWEGRWLAQVPESPLPLTLSELDITDPDLRAMAEEASRMVLLPNNPRPATAVDCQRLLEAIL